MTQRKVVFLLFPRVHLLDVAGPLQVFYEANQLGADQYELHFVGLAEEEFSAQGLGLSHLQAYREISLESGDMILVPGVDFAFYSDRRLTQEERELMSWVSDQHQKGVVVSSICSGSLILAKAGLLDRVKCTSHWKCIDHMQRNYPKVKVMTDRLFVEDRGFVTSAGMTTGIDMALALVERLSGPILAARIAREMVVYIRRTGRDRQHSYYLDYRTHFNPIIHRVQNYLANNIQRNPTIQQLSELFNSSDRNLTRLFKKHVGLTIQEYKDELRLDLAAHLLNNPDYTQRYIAAACGFRDERQFRRLWKSRFGHPPSKHL